MQGNRLARSGKNLVEASTMHDLKKIKVSLRNSEEIHGNRKGKISESDTTLGRVDSGLMVTTSAPWRHVD